MNQTEHHYSDELCQVTAQFIKELAGQYNHIHSKILDFGCGNGNLTEYVQDLFWHSKITGVDQSEESIKSAREDFPAIEFQSTGDRLPFADQAFDIVYSAYVFHHIEKSKRSFWIDELARVTKKDGMIIILEFNPFHIPTAFHFLFNKEEKGAPIIFPSSLIDLMGKFSAPNVHYYPRSRFSSSMYAVRALVDR